MAIQVPDQFVPSVTQSPLGANPMSAQPVQPIRNAAPEQMVEMGQITQKIGEQVGDIGERIQNQMDDAMAKTAVTKFLQSSMATMYGDGKDNPGYLNTRGPVAINGFQDAATAIQKAKQDGQDGLADDFQKSMYNRVASQHLVNFGREMADHRFQQNALYSAQAASDSSDSYNQLAQGARAHIGETDGEGNPSGPFYDYSKQAVDGKLHALFIATGASPESPQGVKAAQEVTTSIALGVISSMIDSHDYKGAQAFFDSENQQLHIDPNTARTLGAQLKRNTDVETIKDVPDQMMDNLIRAKNGQPAGINPQLPIKGGSYAVNRNEDLSQTYIVPPGTAVNAAADGRVDSVSQERPGEPYTVEISHPDGSTTQYANLSAVNYKVGDAVMQGQQPIGLTAKGGLEFSMADKDGKAVDPALQALPAVDRAQFKDPADAQKVISQINESSYDPQMKAQMVSYVDGQQKINYRQDLENKDLTVRPLQDAFYQYADAHKASDGTPTFNTRALTPSQWATLDQLNPELAVRLRNLAVPGGGPAIDGAIDARKGFILHPETQTVDAVNKIRSQVTSGTYLSLLTGAVERRNNPQKVRGVEMDNDQLNTTLVNNHLPQLVSPSREKHAEDFQQRFLLDTAIRDQIDAEQRRTGKELDRPAKQEIIDQIIMDQVHVGTPGAYGTAGGNQFAALLTPQQAQDKRTYVQLGNGQRVTLSYIPNAVHQRIIEKLQAAGIPVTALNIATKWDRDGRPLE